MQILQFSDQPTESKRDVSKTTFQKPGWLTEGSIVSFVQFPFMCMAWQSRDKYFKTIRVINNIRDSSSNSLHSPQGFRQDVVKRPATKHTGSQVMGIVPSGSAYDLCQWNFSRKGFFQGCCSHCIKGHSVPHKVFSLAIETCNVPTLRANYGHRPHSQRYTDDGQMIARQMLDNRSLIDNG